MARRKMAPRALVIAICLLFGLSSFAQQSPSLEQQVNQLSELVRAQQEQINSLQKMQTELLEQLKDLRSDRGQTVVESAGAQAVQTPAAEQMTSVPATGSQYPERGINIGDRVRVGGYGSVRFETNNIASGNNIPSGSAGAFTFRRFVLTTDARPASRLRVFTELEFERLFEIESEKGFGRGPGELELEQTIEGNNGGSIELEQAWAQFDFAERHGIRAGIVLPPVGRFNILHDDDYWDIPRRTLTDRDAPVLPVKSAWRDLGAGLVGSFNLGKTGRLDYQLYGLNGAALDFNLEHELKSEAGSPGTAELVLNAESQLTSGFFDGSKSATAFVWRAAYSPTLATEFALSGYHGKYAPPFLTFREPLTSFAYDHKIRWKGFEMETEAVYTSLGNLNRVLGDFALAAFNTESSTLPTSSAGGETGVTVEMELANLSRRRYGVWSDFKYHARPQWLKKSFLGRNFEDPQIIPIVRYERVWLNGFTDAVSASGFGSAVALAFTQENLEQDRWTAGISYRPTLQFAIQAAYEHNRRINGSRLIFPSVDEDSTNGLLLGMSFAF
jgi:cell division protein FtsB